MRHTSEVQRGGEESKAGRAQPKPNGAAPNAGQPEPQRRCIDIMMVALDALDQSWPVVFEK